MRGGPFAAETANRDERLVAGEAARILGGAEDCSFNIPRMVASVAAATQDSLAS
jgi:hypothetical protein